MDKKNYNVDDILSEIKRKKSQKLGGAEDTEFSAPARPVIEPAANESTEKADKIKDFKLNLSFDYDDTENAADTAEEGSQSEFRFSINKDEPVNKANIAIPLFDEEKEESRNPLDVSEHVRSISDKAKINHGYSRFVSGKNKSRSNDATGSFVFKQDEAPDGFLGGTSAAGDGYTRVLPDFAAENDSDAAKTENLEFMSSAAINYSYDDETDYYNDDIEAGTKVDFSEYNSSRSRNDVATDIAHTKLWLFIRASITLVLTIMSFYLLLAGKYVIPLPASILPEGETVRMFMAVSTILTVFVAIANSSAMGGGLISFFKMRANSDSLVAFAILASIAQGIFGIIKYEDVSPKSMSFYACIAILAMLFNSLGKMSMINRIQNNFRILGSGREKKAVLAVDSPEICRELIPEVTNRRPIVVYGVKAGFFTDFLAHSYSDKYDVGINRSIAPVCVVCSLVVGISTYFLSEDLRNAMGLSLSALTAVLCVCATFSSTFIENVPLSKVAKKLSAYGGMISGSKAVEDFCDTSAVILTESDLFGNGYVSLHGIKPFSQTRVDDVILDAASVLCALDGSLAPVFLQMINGNKDILKKADNIVFENDMGISAWIDSKRILIGNKKLMINHDIAIPLDSYERGEADNAVGEPLYLSVSGELCARFLVSYNINDDLAVELDKLAEKNKQIIVYTNDANISARKIWEIYGYPEELITIMPSIRHRDYKLMSAPREDAVAGIVYTGRASAMVRSVVACINARSSILTATILELIQMILGYGFVAFLAFMGAIGSLSAISLLLYQLLWFVAIFVMQQFKN